MRSTENRAGTGLPVARRGFLRRMAATTLLPVAPLPLLGLAPFEAWFVPDAELWSFWSAHDAESTAVIEHDIWQAFLSAFLRPAPDGINRVDYMAAQKNAGADLDRYVNAMAAIDIRQYNRSQQRAYWINLYNALTVQTVLAHYPVASIRDIDISDGFFSSGPWDKALIEIAGQAVSLNDIEHRILRPIWQDPRLHYAVNCASIGCPNLQARAFTAENTEELLDEGARAYINHPRGLQRQGDQVIVSSIFAWFREDFGTTAFGKGDAAIIAHLQQYLDPKNATRLEGIEKITDYRYDWSLNDSAGQA